MVSYPKPLRLRVKTKYITTLRRSSLRFFLVALFLTSFSPAFADSLWAVDTGLTGHLWTIDTTTGAATQGPALSAQIDGDISWLNGTLYGGFRSDAIGTQGFYSIDPATGVATLIDNSIRVPSLAAIPSLSEFYDVGAAVPGVDIITPPLSAIAQHFRRKCHDRLCE